MVLDIPCWQYSHNKFQWSDKKDYKKSKKNSVIISGQDTRIRFSLEPTGGDPGYVQWKDAMKMVARLPEGVPSDFRKKVVEMEAS